MNINANANVSRWISPFKNQAENSDESKTASVSSDKKGGQADEVIISSLERQAAGQNVEPFSLMETAVQYGDIGALAKAAREKSGDLEVNWDETVDPGGKIFSKTYVQSLVSQYEKASATIEAYYSEAHQQNLSFDHPYGHILQKYKSSDSPYFRSDMSEAERKMAFWQERALLYGGHVTLNDPYALASSGGVLNVKDADRNALQAARDKLDELIKERKEEEMTQIIDK